MRTQQKNLREENFYFSKYSTSIFQNNVATIEKLELYGKIRYTLSLRAS